ncbi:MAG: Cytochrome c-type biogenesis protein CcmH [Hyphomicrobiaceae bacterium hypho_1]
MSGSKKILRFISAHMALLVALLMVTIGFLSAEAVEPDEVIEDPRLELRARNLSAELRCLVCQNQSINDSNAPVARDLRLLVRERIILGDSDAAVIDYLVARYGEFILLRPRFGWHTLLLWISPLLLLVFGLLLVGFVVSKQKKSSKNVASNTRAHSLSASEQQRLERLLSSDRHLF